MQNGDAPGMPMPGSGPMNVNQGSGLQIANHQDGDGNSQYNGHIVNVYNGGDRGKKDAQSEYESTLRWLSPPDPSVDHSRARDQHEPGTCQWLLQHELYKSWKAGGTPRHLWLHGKPGCGKSVICSTVIEDLLEYHKDDTGVVVIYFYFTFSDERKQSYYDLLLSLVSQLGSREPAQSLLQQLRERTALKRPDVHELEKVVITAAAKFDQMILVLDAIDESPELKGVRRDLLKRLNSLVSHTPKLKVVVTSRFIPDIHASMEDLHCGQIAIQSYDVSADIQQYVATQLDSEPRLRAFTPAVKSMIMDNVSEHADGMFKWAYHLIEELTKVKYSGRKAIQTALARFPKDLDEVYERILRDIEEDDQHYALTLLRWITYARRPISLVELVDALIIEPTEATLDFDNRCAPEDILRILSSLVVTVTDRQQEDARDELPLEYTKVRLAHYTVQEFLESTRISEGSVKGFRLISTAEHHFLSQACLTYIIQYSSSSEKKSDHEDFYTFPLLIYAVKEWFEHLRLQEDQAVGRELELFTSIECLLGWTHGYDPVHCWHQRFGETSDIDHLGYALYYAAEIGLVSMVDYLVRAGADIRYETGFYGNALQAACAGGHTKVMYALLAAKPDVNRCGGYHNTALQAATRRGDSEIVQTLINSGADINFRVDRDDTALSIASGNGRESLVQMLLDAGADVNARGGYDGTALQAASTLPNVHVMRTLLAAGADVNVRGGRHGSALGAACARGAVEAVGLLLFKGADVNAHGGYYGTALQAACSDQGNSKVVEMLLAAGADVNADGGRHGSALSAASRCGHKTIAHILLAAGADVNGCGGRYGSALAAALHAGHVELAKILLAAGADANTPPGEVYDSALQEAAEKGNEEIVELLLDAGAEVNSYNRNYINAYTAALAESHEVVARLLEARGATSMIATADDLGRTLLHLSAIRNASKGASFALELGLAVDMTDNSQWTALHWAAYFGSTDVVKLLVEHGANTTLKDWQNLTAYQVAVFAGHSAKLKSLLVPQDDSPGRPVIPGRTLRGLCDACQHELVEQQHHCVVCQEYNLCFRCVNDAGKIHPGHGFTDSFRYVKSW